jgi:hypothetical protein
MLMSDVRLQTSINFNSLFIVNTVVYMDYCTSSLLRTTLSDNIAALSTAFRVLNTADFYRHTAHSSRAESSSSRKYHSTAEQQQSRTAHSGFIFLCSLLFLLLLFSLLNVHYILLCCCFVQSHMSCAQHDSREQQTATKIVKNVTAEILTNL